MNNWKDNLIKKAEEIKTIKEEKNGNSISDRNNSGSSISIGSSISFKRRQDIIKKEEKFMITKEAALEDLEKIDTNAPIGQVIVEVGRIIIKVLASIRSNQLLTDIDKQKIRDARAKRDATKLKK